MPEKLRPTEPLEIAIDEFKNVVSEVYESRGLPGMSILLIDKAKNTAVIEAEVDDDDGEIEMPEHLDGLAKNIFKDIPVLIASVEISMQGVVIEFDTLITLQSDDNRIFMNANLYIDPKIGFDMQNKQYAYKVMHKDYSHDPNDKRIRVRKRRLETDIVNDLTSLVRSVGERDYSYITITKANQ